MELLADGAGGAPRMLSCTLRRMSSRGRAHTAATAWAKLSTCVTSRREGGAQRSLGFGGMRERFRCPLHSGAANCTNEPGQGRGRR